MNYKNGENNKSEQFKMAEILTKVTMVTEQSGKTKQGKRP